MNKSWRIRMVEVVTHTVSIDGDIYYDFVLEQKTFGLFWTERDRRSSLGDARKSYLRLTRDRSEQIFDVESPNDKNIRN
jgi:hypothetical protein